MGGRKDRYPNAKFYAVSKGKKVGIFEQWIHVSPNVTGVSGNQHQGFSTLEDAVSYLRLNGIKDISIHTDKGSYTLEDYKNMKICRNTLPMIDESLPIEVSRSIPGQVPADSTESRCNVMHLENNDDIPRVPEEPTQFCGDGAVDIPHDAEETVVKQYLKSIQTKIPRIISGLSSNVDVQPSINDQLIGKPNHCNICEIPATNGFLKCHECQSKIHYGCTSLPAYQISNLVGSNRRYTCEYCTNVKSDILDTCKIFNPVMKNDTQPSKCDKGTDPQPLHPGVSDNPLSNVTNERVDQLEQAKIVEKEVAKIQKAEKADVGIQTKLMIHNELLCFIRHRLCTTNVEVLVKLCCDFYSEEEIASSKNLLFKNSKTNRRQITRKGDDKARNDMYDLIKLMHELKPDEMPTYMAINLSNIPPLSYDNMDILKLLKEMEGMKNNIDALTSGQRSLVSSQQKVFDLISEKHIVQNNEGKDQSTSRKLTEESAKVVTGNQNANGTDDFNTVLSDASEFPKLPAPAVPGILVSVGDGKITDTVPVSSKNDHINGKENTAVEKKNSRLNCFAGSRSYNRFAPLADADENTNHDADQIRISVVTNSALQNQGNITYTKKQNENDGYCIGSGTFSGLKAVNPYHKYGDNTQNQRHQTSKICLGVFISRMAPKTSADVIDEHVYWDLGHKVRCEKLDTKYNTYTSFFIRCDGRLKSQLLDARNWPKNALVKPFIVNA